MADLVQGLNPILKTYENLRELDGAALDMESYHRHAPQTAAQNSAQAVNPIHSFLVKPGSADFSFYGFHSDSGCGGYGIDLI